MESECGVWKYGSVGMIFLHKHISLTDHSNPVFTGMFQPNKE